MSPRDVYLSDDATEFDLFAVRPSAKTRCGVIYDPADVAAILEIKFYGVYGLAGTRELKDRFQKIKERHGHIQCIYLTVKETKLQVSGHIRLDWNYGVHALFG